MPDPPPSHAPIPAFLPCHPKDAHTLVAAVDALRAHPEVGEITVVAASAMREGCERLGVRHLDESDVLEAWFDAGERFDDDRHWYYQQLLKLELAFGAARDEERYLTSDADSVLLHTFPLIDDAGAVLHPRMTEHTLPYYRGMRELLGLDPIYDGSYVAHFMVFRPAIVREMVAACATHAGRPVDEGIETLRTFLQGCDRTTVSFSEYETYGYYAAAHHPREMRWTQRRQLNVLYVEPTPAVLARLRPHYDYASFHAYRRPDRLWQRFAGSVWLRLRLARDRIGRRRPYAAAAVSS